MELIQIIPDHAGLLLKHVQLSCLFAWWKTYTTVGNAYYSRQEVIMNNRNETKALHSNFVAAIKRHKTFLGNQLKL